MEAKVSAKGMEYYQLEEDDVIRLNDGVEYMSHVKGMLGWDNDTKYLLIPGTGSMVLKGNINESDDEILGDWLNHSIYK